MPVQQIVSPIDGSVYAERTTASPEELEDVLTPLLAKFLSDDAKRQRRMVHVPMGRFGEPIEIANGALFLASDESSFMTGQSLIVAGGITAAYTTPE